MFFIAIGWGCGNVKVRKAGRLKFFLKKTNSVTRLSLDSQWWKNHRTESGLFGNNGERNNGLQTVLHSDWWRPSSHHTAWIFEEDLHIQAYLPEVQKPFKKKTFICDIILNSNQVKWDFIVVPAMRKYTVVQDVIPPRPKCNYKTWVGAVLDSMFLNQPSTDDSNPTLSNSSRYCVTCTELHPFQVYMHFSSSCNTSTALHMSCLCMFY